MYISKYVLFNESRFPFIELFTCLSHQSLSTIKNVTLSTLLNNILTSIISCSYIPRPFSHVFTSSTFLDTKFVPIALIPTSDVPITLTSTESFISTNIPEPYSFQSVYITPTTLITQYPTQDTTILPIAKYVCINLVNDDLMQFRVKYGLIKHRLEYKLLLTHIEPRTIKQVLLTSYKKESMLIEYDSMEKNNTWSDYFHQLDANNVFLNDSLYKEVYMKQP